MSFSCHSWTKIYDMSPGWIEKYGEAHLFSKKVFLGIKNDCLHEKYLEDIRMNWLNSIEKRSDKKKWKFPFSFKAIDALISFFEIFSVEYKASCTYFKYWANVSMRDKFHFTRKPKPLLRVIRIRRAAWSYTIRLICTTSSPDMHHILESFFCRVLQVNRALLLS